MTRRDAASLLSLRGESCTPLRSSVGVAKRSGLAIKAHGLVMLETMCAIRLLLVTRTASNAEQLGLGRILSQGALQQRVAQQLAEAFQSCN
jgi:hypothetical protein